MKFLYFILLYLIELINLKNSKIIYIPFYSYTLIEHIGLVKKQYYILQ